MHWIFLAVLLAAIALVSLGQLSVWVIVLAMLAKSLAVGFALLVFGVVGYVVWRLWHQRCLGTGSTVRQEHRG